MEIEETCDRLATENGSLQLAVAHLEAERDKLQALIDDVLTLRTRNDGYDYKALEESLLLPCPDTTHDDRWCAHCSSRGDGMELMLAEIERRIDPNERK